MLITPQLFANGYRDEAVAVLAKYHGEGDKKSPMVQLTFREMVQEVYIEGSDKRWWDFTDLFNSKNAWWRNACVIGMAFCSQVPPSPPIGYSFLTPFPSPFPIE